MLRYFYDSALSWAYEPDNNPLPREAIEKVLQQQKMFDMELPWIFFPLEVCIYKVTFTSPTSGEDYPLCSL
jgi:hypothetical protein